MLYFSVPVLLYNYIEDYLAMCMRWTLSSRDFSIWVDPDCAIQDPVCSTTMYSPVGLQLRKNTQFELLILLTETAELRYTAPFALLIDFNSFLSIISSWVLSILQIVCLLHE